MPCRVARDVVIGGLIGQAVGLAIAYWWLWEYF